MSQIQTITLTPQEAFDEANLKSVISQRLNIPSENNLIIQKRSVDARGRRVVVHFSVEIFEPGEQVIELSYNKDLPDVHSGEVVQIIGAGPAGMFAALKLIELGFKPVIFERGKDVRARRRDIAAINKDDVVNPDSNYCFGEGGAGTYSDGKLYTRSGKRGDIRRILEILHVHGAPESILFDAHPHIGTNKLPGIITSIRESILAAGGEIHFGKRVTDFVVRDNKWTGLKTQDGDFHSGKKVILATGHSARDIFYLLHEQKILIEPKPFALGVRVEHAQQIIDQAQYHCSPDRGPYLPAAAYALVHQFHQGDSQRGVFSFCMCPGGFIVPSATNDGEIVVNGMSPSRRDSRFANSGIVVAVDLKDFAPYQQYGPLAGLHFQSAVEQAAFLNKGQAAPAQRLEDFIQRKNSSTMPETSYQPGLVSANLSDILPGFIGDALRSGFMDFGKKIKGYRSNDAVVVGVESRTSSPVRVPRDQETLQHPQVEGLYPCGEGAGYAGGIVSAAMDGERVASAIGKV